MQLRAVLAGLRQRLRVVRGRPEQLPDVLLARIVGHAVGLRSDAESEGVAVEGDDARIALAGFEPLNPAFFEQ
jgi:hypothetical protein